jgi:membrane-associated phospholipid phosphatase
MRYNARTPLLAAGVCAVAFGALLACAYTVGQAERLDATALHGLGTLQGSWSAPLAHLAAHLADPLPLLVVLAALFAWGWARGRRREAVAALALVAGANVTTQLLKIVLAHPRIQPVLGNYQLGAEAFPSGHATASMSLGLAAVLVAPARLRVVIASVATAYVIAVSTSVLILEWHFPSDVVGGLLVASGFFFGAVAVVRHLAARESSPAARRGTGLALPRVAISPALAGLAGIAVLVVLRAQDLLSFARLHTVATATALAIMATSAALLASATLFADDRR